MSVSPELYRSRLALNVCKRAKCLTLSFFEFTIASNVWVERKTSEHRKLQVLLFCAGHYQSIFLAGITKIRARADFLKLSRAFASSRANLICKGSTLVALTLCKVCGNEFWNLTQFSTAHLEHFLWKWQKIFWDKRNLGVLCKLWLAFLSRPVAKRPSLPQLITILPTHSPVQLRYFKPCFVNINAQRRRMYNGTCPMRTEVEFSRNPRNLEMISISTMQHICTIRRKWPAKIVMSFGGGRVKLTLSAHRSTCFWHSCSNIFGVSCDTTLVFVAFLGTCTHCVARYVFQVGDDTEGGLQVLPDVLHHICLPRNTGAQYYNIEKRTHEINTLVPPREPGTTIHTKRHP